MAVQCQSATLNFQEWLEKNRDHIKGYEAWEVARLALACGFTLQEITPDTSEWISASQRRLRLWESPFHAKWLAVTLGQMGKEKDV